jgi:predicted DNA-binding transcriptional regulator AlpA
MNTHPNEQSATKLFHDDSPPRTLTGYAAPTPAPEKRVQQVAIDPLLTGNEVDATLGIKKTKRYKLLKAGLLPKPVYLGARCVRWRKSAIEGYIASLGGGSTVK